MDFESEAAGQATLLKTSSGKKRPLAGLAVAAALAIGTWLSTAAPLGAAGETRTMSLYHIHTKESITVTYMENGRYVPSAMKKINYLLRDWRKNKVVTIDPKSIDLMWELHADLGSRAPIHIVCGLRTGNTNALLRRMGRKVAKHSQHVKGKAIDFYFPDVPTKKIRNSALVRRVGGVGYYRSAGGPTGFLHVDTGNVRHWGPAISRSEWAKIMREGNRTVGRRMSRDDSIAVASVGGDNDTKGGGILGRFFGKKQPKIITEPDPVPAQAKAEPEEKLPPVPNYEGSEDLAELADEASVAPKSKVKPAPEFVPDEVVVGAAVAEARSVLAPTPVPQPKPVVEAKAGRKPADQGTANAQLAALAQTAATEQAAEAEPVPAVEDDEIKASIRKGDYVPRPRMKPTAIKNLVVASAIADDFKIEPASAEPDTGMRSASPVADKLLAKKKAEAARQAAADRAAEEEAIARANAEAEAAPAVEEAFVSPDSNVADGKSDFAAELRDGRTDEAPVIRSAMLKPANKNLLVPVEKLIRQNGAPPPLESEATSVLPEAEVAAAADGNSEGKGDLVLINRDGKGNMEDVPDTEAPARQKLGQL